ncbi:hypothetical protein [Dactylosporangium sp. CA-139066]|uniref:PGAP1-like alpha/beta domain-containing protein n=1 Tax=Dactylosporangium sp. CA-139066 TaxID=3239930 RepID=UPI003D93DCB6
MTEPTLHVSGGVGGTEARYDDLLRLAAASGELGERLAEVTAECHTALADPNLLASAKLNPAGAARFAKQLLEALDGRSGLTALAGNYYQRSLALQAVIDTYRAADAASTLVVDKVRFVAGEAFVDALPVGVSALSMVGVPAYLMYGGDWQLLLTDHPGIIDNVVGAAPGMLTEFTGMPVTTVPGAAHLIATLYPDGHPHVEDLGVDTNAQVNTPPAGFGDVMAGLDYRNRPHQDVIDVKVITHADGTKAYIVDIPGTKVWNEPGSLNPASNDFGTNIHVTGGDTTAREMAIAEALRRAGATSTDPVMLVGHSQGGMVAAQAAADTANGTFNFNVTHVMTAGSPIANADIPPTVQVLALENTADVVPHLDAHDNPDTANFTTVQFDNQHGTIGENHSIDRSYLPAAQALDNSTDPSVLNFRNSAGAFMGGAPDSHVQTNAYALSRVP